MKVTIRDAKIDDGATVRILNSEKICCQMMMAQLDDVRELPELWKHCPFCGEEIERIEAGS